MRLFIALCVSVTLCAAGETRLGKPLSLKQTVPISALAESPEQHVGKMVQVKGKVSDLCQKMGCWMNLADTATGKTVRIKVRDGEIVFPKSAVGKMAIAEGQFAKLELSEEQAIAIAKHEAEENGRKFDPASIKGPKTIYQINGVGAVILD